MSDISRAQKVRLGLFLLMALLLAAAAILIKVGESVFKSQDRYYTRISGGVGGLLPGADVTYNGIVVGDVRAVMVDPIDVAMVRIELDLKEGTPIPEDTTATVGIQGITGTRRVELTGGTNTARRRKPGEEIPAGRGVFDDLIAKAKQIGDRVDQIGERVQLLTSDENLAYVTGTLENTERASVALAALIEDTRPRVQSLLASAEKTSEDVREALVDVRKVARNLDKTVASANEIVSHDVKPLLADARKVVARVDGFVDKAAGVLGHIDVAFGRASGDVQRVLVELADGIDSVTDLAEMLRRDPSSIIQGKSPGRGSP